MKVRVTIMLDASLDKMIRQRQARTIRDTNHTYSYSTCVSDMLSGKKE